MVNCNNEDSEDIATDKIKKVFTKYQIKSKSVTPEKGIELVFEVRMKDGETSLINDLSQVDGVTNAVLVSYNGDYVA
ncbi:twin-arginine translocating C-subunit [Clostridioides difficile]|nr:twin-arginine translocating C-subunit [Clostridioides difficile]